MRYNNVMRHGFSLVELSIVLVILGLLTGGILGGQSLIRAAELRSVSTEYNRYITAMQTFRDKYFALPGDMANATSFWGASSSCPGTAGTGTQTCNGNGNGRIGVAAAASQYGEDYTFWQHLANAGLIEGTYTGMAGSAGGTHRTVDNSPRGKLSNSLWMIDDDGSSVAAMFPVAVARHNFRLGGTISNGWPHGKLLTPEEMWNVDTKMDDSRPGFGAVTGTLSTYGSLSDCSTSDTASSADYELSIRSKECIFLGSMGI